MTPTTVASSTLDALLDDVGTILRTAGTQLVGSLTLSRNVLSIQPTRLDQGQVLADALGLETAIEQTAVVPPITDWSGTIGGLEVHVRGTRSRAGAVV
ncbi:hypothetical protein [Antribacter gilvus]|uniref:hypothetical protein n=1 Tax=Antribacter gilvus TaxID=2304675 RepID=UPI000F781956|nr:hypothetical protein [Antribacter gilvus]